MDNPRPEKVAVVTEVRERLSSANGALLTEYRGLKVEELARLRQAVREAGGEYKIYKNTLARLAVRELGMDELVDLLEGPTAIAFVQGDAVNVAKSLRDFARTSPSLVIKGGLLGTSVLSAPDASALADVAPREVILAQLAGALAAPLQQLAGLLQALPRNFAYGLSALIDKGGEQGAAPAAAAPEPQAEAAPPPEAEPAEAEPATQPPETAGAPDVTATTEASDTPEGSQAPDATAGTEGEEA